jgi:hypothetical protein
MTKIKKKMGKTFFYDHTENTIRGSFINILITAIYAGLAIAGCFVDTVAHNIEKQYMFLIGFFATSFGMWSGKKILETRTGYVDKYKDIISNLKQKIGSGNTVEKEDQESENENVGEDKKKRDK